jgi:excisionase family DNA binding protein
VNFEARIAAIEETQAEILTLLREIVEKRPKDVLTVKEFARAIGKSEDYVRELCRDGRLNFTRTNSGRGGKPEFRLSARELARYQREGSLRQLAG